MTNFDFKQLDLKGAFLIENFSVGDSRGGFTKCFEKNIYESAGIDFGVSESFLSISARNVIRGIHFQLHNPQAKLVCVPQGRVYDVLVDLRINSPTLGKWRAFELSADNHRALYIPRGFGHGFASLEEQSIMLYQCDGIYDKETDTGIRFDDAHINIEWPIPLKQAICSERDMQLMSFEAYCEKPMDATY